jgi:O-antigen/teichoic acid export membrane protein
MGKADAPAFETPQAQPRASMARNAFHLVLGQVATTGLAIVFSAALGRTLGPGDFGLYFLISSFATFAYVVVDWGQQFYVIREVARTPQRGGDLLGSALVLRTVGAVLAAIPAGLVSWLLGYDARTCWFTVAFMLVLLPFFLSQACSFVFRGRDRMELDAVTSVVNRGTGLALALGALALGTGLGGVVVAQGLAGCAALWVAARLYRRVAVGPVRFSRKTAREVLAGGTGIVSMMIAVQIQPYLDAIIISKMVPAEVMGWFGAAKSIMGTLIAPALIIAAAAYPRLSRTSSSISVFKSEFQASLRPILLLGALGGLGTFLFADGAIALVYGHRNFSNAGIVLKVFGPGLFFLFIDVLFGNALTALGRAGAFSVVKVASIVVSTGLDLILIPWFQARQGNGGIGAVVAFILSEFVVFGGAVFLMPRGTLGRGILVDTGRAVASVAATALLFEALPPLPLFLGIPICVGSFSLCALAVGLLRRRDLEQLGSLLRKRAPEAVAPASALGAGAGSSSAT